MTRRQRQLRIPSAETDAALEAGADATNEEAAWPAAVASWLDEEGGEHLRYTLSRDARERLDKHLQSRIKGLSRHQVQKLIALGGVRVNDREPKPSLKLKAGDTVDVILPPRPSSEIKAEPIPLEILHEDEDMIVLNKQAGLIVHPARSQLTGTMLNALAYHFQQQRAGKRGMGEATDRDAARVSHADGTIEGLSNIGADDARPGIVHRLDKNTTGVIVVAKRDESHWLLARQFEARSNLKAYLALIHGCPELPGGALEFPIGKHPTIREAMAVRHDASSKHALTLYRVRERYEGYSLVELELKTGRTHQIRVHLAYAGCPIVGDLLYGGEVIGEHEIMQPPLAAGAREHVTYARPKGEGERLETQAMQREDLLMSTPALHAGLLQLKHPVSAQTLTFTAPVPSPMRDVIERLRERPAAGEVVHEGVHIDLDQALPRRD